MKTFKSFICALSLFAFIGCAADTPPPGASEPPPEETEGYGEMMDAAAGLGDEGGELPVDLTFTSMKDFTPAAIAEKVPALKELYDARNELKSLLTFMDGKMNAEKTIKELLANETLMKSLASSNAAPEDSEDN